jgi:hypothetical protein
MPPSGRHTFPRNRPGILLEGRHDDFFTGSVVVPARPVHVTVVELFGGGLAHTRNPH